MDDFRQVINFDELTSDDTITLARAAAEAIRGLNWATRHQAGLDQPSAAYDILGALSLAASRLPQPARTPVLGAVAGLGYGVLAVAARVLPGFDVHQLIRDPAAYALAAAGVVSFMLYATALEDGSVTVATAAVVLAETVPPAVVGIMFLGDHTRPGMGGVAVLGFSLAVVCAVALARFGETDEQGLTAAQRRVRQAAEADPRPYTAS